MNRKQRKGKKGREEGERGMAGDKGWRGIKAGNVSRDVNSSCILLLIFNGILLLYNVVLVSTVSKVNQLHMCLYLLCFGFLFH